MRTHKRFVWTVSLALGLLALARMDALAADIPLTNWKVARPELAKAFGGLYVPFTAVEPCRLVDTRPASGFPPAWGAPALVANATRSFDLNSAPHCPGIPFDVEAYSINVTVTEVTGPGDIRVWPEAFPPNTPTSVQNWTQSGPGFAIANAIVVGAGADGGVTVQMAGSSGHLLIDINGFFSENDPSGVFGFISSTSSFTSAFFNLSSGTAVLGESSSGHGVQGRSHAVGVAQSSAVRGEHLGGGALGNGVWGSHTGTGNGVYGTTGTGGHAGVYGVSGSGGVGVRGNGSGAFGYGVFVEGALGTTGTKQFVEPHPTDPALAIRFVSLEGPEAGTYFRGRSKFAGGLATIAVPETFRAVTAEEGLTIQVTPIGEMATVAVVRLDLNEIVVKGSRNVEFCYLVQGERRAYRNWNPIGSSDLAFRPRTPEDKLPDYLSEDARERLIANGTYNKDGSVNLETARKLGWDKDWNKPAGSPKQ